MPTTTDRIDGLNAGLAMKAPVKAYSVSNLTLSGEQTVNGVALVENDRVLVRAQTTASANGIYKVQTGAWLRAGDFDGARDAVTGSRVLCSADYTEWVLTTTGTITIGTTSLAFAQTESNSFNVQHYGAVGDGTTDDSAAFTAAFAALRSAVTAAAGGSHTLLIPPGKYRINTSINATLINPGTDGPKILVSGYGADINGYCTGKPVFDAIGSAQIVWEGLYVEGISGSEPTCAFMIGRYSDGVSASNNSFRNVKTWGYFTRAGLHNIASEQCQFHHCQFSLRGTATASAYSTYNTGNTQFGAIFDGINYYGATSDYQSMSGLTQYTAQSFLNNSVYNCSFRGGQSGDRGGGLLLMGVSSFRAQDSYVVARGSWPGTVIGVYSGIDSNGVWLDVHSETATGAEISHCVYFKDMDSSASQIQCEDLVFTETAVHAQTAIIGTNLASSNVVLQNASINIGSFNSGAPALLPLFDSPARYRVSGEIIWTRGNSFQGTALDRFTGEIYGKFSYSTVTVANSGGDALFSYSGSDWWVNDNKVQLTTTGVLPTGFAAGTVYYVVSADAGANTFKLSASSGGSAIAYTDAGTGTHRVTIDFQHPTTPSSYTLRDMTDNTTLYYADHTWATNIYSNGPLIGYTTGAGGTVTQATNKTTGVTLNKTVGEITMNAASLAGGATVSFQLSNSYIVAGSSIQVHRKSGGTDEAYEVWVDKAASGNCTISVRNRTGGALAEAVVLTFMVFNGVTA